MVTDRHSLSINNAAMLLYGLSAVLLGPTLPGMISGFGLTLSEGGLIGSAQNAGGFAAALAALWVGDRLPRALTAVVSFVLLAAALISVSFAQTYLALVLTIASTGFFIRLLDVMLNAHTGAIAGPRSGRRMSVLHMFFSIGAFAGPIVARGIMTTGALWNAVYLYTGVAYLVAVAVSAWWLRTYIAHASPHPDASRPNGSRPDSSRPDASRPDGSAPGPRDPGRGADRSGLRIVFLGAALFFYAVHQIGFTSWIPYFLEIIRGSPPTTASFGLSLYWVGIIAGRFLASRVVERTGVVPVLIGGCIASAAASVAAVLASAVPVAQGLLLLAGATSGATIPLAYSMGFASVPLRTARVTAAMSVLMLAGRLLSPWLVGVVADATALVPAMVIPGLALVVSGALIAIASRVRA